jgi:diadenylate cyclase
VSDVFWVLSHIQASDIVDILLVAVVFYLLFSLAQGTQAVQLLRGMVLVILVLFLASQMLPLQGFSWLVETALPALLIAIPVIFQPELRRALERLGRTGSLLVRVQQEEEVERMIDEVARAAHRLSSERHGALIVFERETGLQEFIETGVALDAEVKAELLRTRPSSSEMIASWPPVVCCRPARTPNMRGWAPVTGQPSA